MDRSRGIQLNPAMHDYKVPTSDTPRSTALFVDAPTYAAITLAQGLAEPPISDRPRDRRCRG